MHQNANIALRKKVDFGDIDGLMIQKFQTILLTLNSKMLFLKAIYISSSEGRELVNQLYINGCLIVSSCHRKDYP